MPLTRQEVENLDVSFLPGDEESHRALEFNLGEYQNVVQQDQPDSTWVLLAAAPELALACLEARDFAVLIRDTTVGATLPGLAGDLLRAIDAALALAGVQP